MIRFGRSLLAVLLGTGLCAAQDDPKSAEYFERSVRPVLAQSCQGCHNPKLKRAGLDLTSGEGFHRGADSGPLVSSETPRESRILQVVGYHERIKMPPTGKIKDAEIAALTAWVEAGANWPGVDPKVVAEAKAAQQKGFSAGQRRFWSFQPRKAVTPPAIESPWIQTPIDAFILAKLEEKKLAPAPPAGKLSLLRRATYDLTGLPPTIDEIDAFMKDTSPQAFENVVDRLMASPRYGERWGRHWMDVARYADSTGADEDHRYPDAWRYRDYVIDAMNRDLPYDKFVREQIAGDLLPPEGADVAIGVNRRGTIATGFLAIGPRLIAEQDKKKMYYDFVDEQVATTSRAFLGLTLDCARCHDHKFDPLLQKDYYAMAGIFASSKAFSDWKAHVSVMYRPPLVSKQEFEKWETAQKGIKAKRAEIELIDQEQSMLRMNQFGRQLARYLTGESGLDAEIAGKWKKYLADETDVRPYLSRWDKAGTADRAAVAKTYQEEFLASAAEYTVAVDKWKDALARAALSMMPGPDKPNFDVSEHRFFEDVYLKADGPFARPKQPEVHYRADIRARRAALNTELEALTKASPPEPERAIGIVEGDPVAQKLFVRGDVYAEGELVPKGFPSILTGGNPAEIREGSGRLELANWLTDPANPLVSRVMVNRIWQGHFGEGIVRTPSNFGLLGEKPTHPELLDWLAQRFIDDGWSVKKMHKLIMLSSAYQQSSDVTKEKFEADAPNRLWSRFQRRRLDVEEIRDSMLAIDGTIDWTVGGSLQEGLGTDGENSSKRLSIDPSTAKRRTVYIPLRRSNLPGLLNLFDFGDATTTNEQRSRTNVAPQALFSMNSPFVNARAGVLAEQTRQTPLESAIREGFLRVLGRPAKDGEVSTLYDYAKRFPGDSEFAGRRSVYRILFGLNEFIYVD